MGFGFASFLLGDYSLHHTDPESEFTREGSQEWGLFAQDSWKVRRNLTVTYGVRWDYATPEHEQYGRLGQLDPTLPNANAGGALGAVQYASTCNCNFYKSAYPFALGPRLGVAYQLTAQDGVARWMGIHLPVRCIPSRNHDRHERGVSSIRDQPIRKHCDSGLNCAAHLARYQSLRLSALGTVGIPGVSDPYVPDGNENRPPRINQFSFGIQQEITQEFHHGSFLRCQPGRLVG